MARLIAAVLLCAAFAVADERADRAAIESVIRSLNSPKPPSDLFTTDAQSDLDRLKAAHGDTANGVWSEVPPGISWPFTVSTTPVVLVDSVRFLSSDVAVANATAEAMGGFLAKTPILLVMKRDAGTWKIAVLKILASDRSDRSGVL